MAVLDPAGIDHWTGCAQLAAERLGQCGDHRDVLLLADPASGGDDDSALVRSTSFCSAGS